MLNRRKPVNEKNAMNRQLIIGERIMYVNAETPVNCVFTVKLNGHFTLRRLQNALAKIQARHPLLRVVIKEDKKGRPYFVSDNDVPAIPVRIVERFSDEDWLNISKTEWATLFDTSRGPLARIVWLRSDEVSELVWVSPHCICDGATGVTLMRELLALLDNPDKEIGVYESFDHVKELMPASLLSDKGKKRKAKFFSLLAGLILSMKAAGKKAQTGRPYMVRWKMNHATTTAVLQACKENNVSVHAALCVALLQAFREVNGGQARNKVICPADIRRYIPEIGVDTMFAFAPIVDLSLPKEAAGFWKTAASLKETLGQKLSALKVHELLLFSEYFHRAAPKMVHVLKTTAGSHDITFSNMGRLDIQENYQTFSVEDIYSPSVAFPWRNPNTLVVSSFRGRMDFAFLSNEHFLTEEKAQAIRDKTLEILQSVTVGAGEGVNG